MKSEFLERLPEVRTFVFSFEGVLAGSDCIMDDQGNLSVKINAKDIRILNLALNNGYGVYFLSENVEDQKCLNKLFRSGNVQIIEPGYWKPHLLEDYLRSKNIKLEEVLMMVADAQHFDLLNAKVLTSCPYDAIPDVFSAVHYVSSFKGGEGCIREILEKVLKVHGDWK